MSSTQESLHQGGLMDLSSLETLWKVAGLGGIAIGVVFLFVRRSSIKCHRFRIGGCRPAESFSRSSVESCGGSGESLGAVHAQVGTPREVLEQQAVFSLAPRCQGL
jgi:hypothetical protein